MDPQKELLELDGIYRILTLQLEKIEERLRVALDEAHDIRTEMERIETKRHRLLELQGGVCAD